ncbi:MAG: hypothetical protein LRY27_01410 [Chitinophagales bacterium]|nr:hypothetical protein [Chitinophagales bacterium]
MKSICFFIPEFENQYPNISLPTDKPVITKIDNGSYFRPYISVKCNENNFSFLPRDTLTVFIFDAQVIEDSTWNSIRDNYLILKRYDLSFQDLDSMGWEITYP